MISSRLRRLSAFLVAGVFALWSSFSDAQVVLDVGDTPQEHSNWCWVGVSQSVLSLYGPTGAQCDIAEWARNRNPALLGYVDCCTIPTYDFESTAPCNALNWNWGYDGSIQDILASHGVPNYGKGGTLTFDEIKTAIDAGLPFVPRWEYATGYGHFLVGHGYMDDANQTVYYWNPWPGEGFTITSYNWMVQSNDEEAHIWTHTNVLTPVEDSDTSNDSESDIASDTDIDTDTTIDISTEKDTNDDFDTNTYNDTNINLDTDTYFDTNSDININTDFDTDIYIDTNTNSDTNIDSDTKIISDTDSNFDTETDVVSDTELSTDSAFSTDTYLDTYGTDSDTESIIEDSENTSDSDTSRDTDSTYPDPDAGGRNSSRSRDCSCRQTGRRGPPGALTPLLRALLGLL